MYVSKHLILLWQCFPVVQSPGRVITKSPYQHGSVSYNAEHRDEWASHYESRWPRKLKYWGIRNGVPEE